MSKHTFMFQFNIPQDNHAYDRTDGYINVLAEWDGKTFYGKGNKPIIYTAPINMSFSECIAVKNWTIAHNQIEKIAENHFADIARKERISKAKAELMEAGELINNPVLERYQSNVNPLIGEIIANHFTPVV